MYNKARYAQKELADYISQHPELGWQQIAHNKNVSVSHVSKIAKTFGLSRQLRNTPLQHLRPLFEEDVERLKVLLGTGTCTIKVNYLGNIKTLKNKATNVIPAEFLLEGLDGPEWGI